VSRPPRRPAHPSTSGSPDTPRRSPGQEADTTAEIAASPANGESRYPPGPAQPDDRPLKVHIELRLVHGPAGKQLRARQAAAIREALRWFAEHPHGSDHGEDPP
jgi:hypothetical protein